MNREDFTEQIARHINPGSRVLELGVATGYFSRFLSGKLGCTVDGVELDPQMAEQARPFLSKLVVGDLEMMELSGEFPRETYDWVVLADTLEHLRDPSFVLKQLPGLLAEGGKVIISIPNTAYAGLILELLGGGLTYRSEGLLDRTHLRFYTRSSFTALLQELGYTVESAEPVRLPVMKSEFTDAAEVWNPLANYVLSRPDADAYRFVFVAAPESEAARPVAARTALAQAAKETPRAATTTVDVIVPAAGSREGLERTLKSVLLNRQQTQFETIVVVAGPLDGDAADYLDELRKEGRITLLDPGEAGFTDAANLGMFVNMDRDTVLINPGCEVSGDWLDRMCTCARNEPHAATVSTFTNAAGVGGYPLFMEDNALPDGMTAAALDVLFSRLNEGCSAEVSFTDGICVYISRRCAQLAGYLDSLHFSDGGAITDFSLRARDAGFRNLICGSVFVYADTQAAARAVASRSPEPMFFRFPHFEDIVAGHRLAQPQRPLRRRVDLERLAVTGRARLLNLGGVDGSSAERHIHQLSELLAPDYDSLLLKPAGTGRVSLDWVRTGEEFSACFNLPGEFDRLTLLLKQLGVERVNVHDTLGLPLELVEELGVPYDVTLHDFIAICPMRSFRSYFGGYCGEPHDEACDNCLRVRNTGGGPLSRDIRAWRSCHADLLGAAERVLAPSHDCLDRYRRYYPEANYIFLPLPGQRLRPGREPGSPPTSGGKTVRVLALGELAMFEETLLLEACAADAAGRGLGITFRALGRSLQSARREPELPLSFFGPYDQDKLPELIEREQADVIMFPHRLPLAHSWSLGAAMAAGLPIVAPDLGVFPERLENHPDAFLAPSNGEASAWNDLIMRIANMEIIDVNKP